jgi:phosphohistidine phosphatase SixA
MKYFLPRLVLPALLLCQLAAAQNVHTIFLVRHAEKASGAPDAGLSPQGQKRAECLATMLKDAGIKHIYVTDAKRTQETAAPLAKDLKITPTVIPAKDPNSMIRDMTYSSAGNILAVGHSNTLPFILARMKAGTIPPIGEDEYDRMYVLTVTESATASMAELHYCELGPAAKPAKKPATHKTPAKKPTTHKH